MTPIVSPSYKRAGRVAIRKWLPSVILAVHEFEFEDYLEKEGEPLLKLSDKLRGNMAKVRNQILETMFEETDWLVTMDDDVESVGYFRKGSPHRLDSAGFEDFVTLGFEMASDLGAKLWGVNLQSDPKFYREFNPFSFQLPVLGPFSCHMPSGLRYDERLSLNEDYDFAIQHLHRHHKLLRFNQYHYRAGHLTDKGGCAAYRTLEEERKQAGIMTKKWGPRVVRYNLEKSTNPKITVPIRGV